MMSEHDHIPDDFSSETPDLDVMLDNDDSVVGGAVQTVETVQNAADETSNETVEEDATPTRDKRPFWVRWHDEMVSRRLDDLNLGIELYPKNPSNYVLRGELFLETKQEELAQADFSLALQLVSEQVTTDRWGLVAQSVQDRAIMGLRRVNISE